MRVTMPSPSQLSKLLGQHLLRDARNRALQVGEAQRITKEMEEDDELPAPIQPSDGVLDSGGSRRGRVRALTHGCVPSLSRALLRPRQVQVCSPSMPTHAKVPIDLPSPIAAYFASDTSDANAVARCFSESAVGDRRATRTPRQTGHHTLEGRGHRKVHHYTSEPLAVVVSGAEVIVTARVTENFPGSPVDLRYLFTLEGATIARLEITT